VRGRCGSASATAAWTGSIPRRARSSTLAHDVTALLLDSGGSLWIGTENEGLLQLPPGTTTPVSWLPKPGDRHSLSSEKITMLREDREHRLWIGTQDGLNEIDPKRTKVTRYAPDTEYPLRTTTYLKFVTAMFQDKADTLWFGTLELGLYKLTPLRRAFRNYVNTAEFGNPMAFCDGKDGLVWAGTYSHGLYAYNFTNETYRAYPALGSADDPARLSLTDWLTTVHCARDGTIWIGGSGLGLVSFNPATNQYKQYPPDPDGATGPISDRIEQILEGRDGTLWLAGWGGGLSRFDPKTKQFALVTRDERVLPSAYLHRILFDVADPNVLWVGAAQGGVARLDLRTNTSTVIRGPNAGAASGANTLSNDSVLSLYQEPNGRLWIGTDGGGLNAYDPSRGTITKFGLKDGLPSNVIYGILHDDANHLWLTTSKGLVRFDLATNKSVTFTSADGLGSTEFNQNAYFRSASGAFLVATLNGFNRFEPKSIVPDSFVPPAVFTNFRVFDKERALPRPIWDTAEVELSHRDSAFTVEFATLAFAAPAQTRYQYMLEGFRNEWLSTERGQITFTNLDAGDYVLNIKTINRHGAVNETPTKLRIHIEPPLWRTKPAYALYLALLIGAGLFVVHLQRQRLVRVEREGRLALVEQELQLTGAVQSGFLPASNDIATRHVRITGAYKPAESCSGDWWWHAQLDSARHVVLVGDVTGHGAGPAMVTAAVATAFHVFATTKSHVDIDEMLELLNREVLRVGKGHYQMTLAALELDSTVGSWTLYNVGAPPILVLDTAGKHKVHFCPGSLLGTAENFVVGKLTGRLAPTERILLYTDGIPEIQLPGGKLLGTRKLAQIYEQTRSQPVPVAAASLMNYAVNIQGQRPQLDDWTFALVEWVHAGAA